MELNPTTIALTSPDKCGTAARKTVVNYDGSRISAARRERKKKLLSSGESRNNERRQGIVMVMAA
jgi:hypothetical protein